MFDHYEYLHMKVLINYMGNRKETEENNFIGWFYEEYGRKKSKLTIFYFPEI